MSNLKCVRCVQDFLELPQEERHDILTTENAFDNRVSDCVTFIPSWQQQQAGPGQLLMSCIALPICLRHIAPPDPSVQPVVSRAGLVTG
jgi:hypothetical protein